MLFIIVATTNSKPILHIEKKTREILVFDTFDSRFLKQKKSVYKAFLNKNTYKNVFKSLINVLLKFLQADFFAKKITQ